MQIRSEFSRFNPLFGGEGSYGDKAIAVLTDDIFVPFLGTEAKGQTFSPTGTSGQLAIGGTNVASRAEVTALVRTDWQGTITLSKNPRTNLLRGSVWAGGGGSPPTEWTIFQAGTGSMATAASTLDTANGANAILFTCTTAARQFFYQTVVLAPRGPYILSLWVESAPAGTLAPSDIFSYGTAPGDIVVSYPSCPANPSGGQGSVLTTGRLDILISSVTGGNFDPRIGLGASGTLDGVAVRLSHPQMMRDTVSRSWIPTTTAAASITDYSYTNSGAVTLGQTASGTYAWSGYGVLSSGPTFSAVGALTHSHGTPAGVGQAIPPIFSATVAVSPAHVTPAGVGQAIPPIFSATVAVSHAHGAVAAVGQNLGVTISGTGALTHSHGTPAGVGQAIPPIFSATVAVSHSHGTPAGVGQVLGIQTIHTGTAALTHGHGTVAAAALVNPAVTKPLGPEAVFFLPPYRSLAHPRSGKARIQRRAGQVRGKARYEPPAEAVGAVARRAGGVAATATFEAMAFAHGQVSRPAGGVAGKGEFEDTELIEILLLIHDVA